MIYLGVFMLALLLLFFGWCLFGLLLMPVFREDMVTLCFQQGAGVWLEQRVRAFHWLRDQQGGIMVIVDCGLTKEGVELAQSLCEQYSWLSYCPAPVLSEHLSVLQDTI